MAFSLVMSIVSLLLLSVFIWLFVLIVRAL